MHKIPTELLQKSTQWRNDIQFRQDVLGKPFDFTSTWGIFSPKSSMTGA